MKLVLILVAAVAANVFFYEDSLTVRYAASCVMGLFAAFASDLF